MRRPGCESAVERHECTSNASMVEGGLGLSRGSKIENMTDDKLKALFDGLRQETAAMRQENAATHIETRRHFEIIAERLGNRIDTENAAMRQENAAEHIETRRHFVVIAEHLEKRIDAVTEAIASVDEKFERRFEDLEER